MENSLFNRDNNNTGLAPQPEVCTGLPQEKGIFGKFVERTKQHWKGVAFSLGLGIAAVSGVAATEHIEPKEYDITEVGRDFIDYTEVVAPLLVGGAAAHAASLSTSLDRRTQLRLAWRGLSMPSENVTLKKAVVAGSLLPALGIGALSTALMIEDGIHEGANRNINSIEESIASESNNESVTWFLQDGTGHFMNDSVITSEQFEAIQEHISNGDLGADAPVLAPFRRDLVTLPTPYSDNQASMIISVDSSGPGAALLPDVQKESALCELVDDTCALEKDEIIVDEGEGFVVGDQVSIRGDEYTVVAHPETPQSLVNRLIAYSGSKAGEQTDDHYGFVSVSKSNDSLSALINTANSVELQALSTDEFLAKNEDFWSHNGTPLLILLIADIAVFGGATFASTKRFEQERNAAAVATLQAIGMTKRQLAEQELARNTIMTAKGVVPGALGAVATTQFINSALPGFEGKVTPGMVFGSTGLILAVQGLATLKSIRQTNRRSPIEAMKQK